MRPFLWLMAATLPLVAQPKLLVNAKVDTHSAAAGLEQAFRPLVTALPQPAWIGYSVPSTRVNLGCDYVRDGWSQPGVIHLEPPDHAVILFRVDGGAVERIRTLSPDCEIDAGDLPETSEVEPNDTTTDAAARRGATTNTSTASGRSCRHAFTEPSTPTLAPASTSPA